ncbi:MAG: exo-alpha-sialidase [Betaproteobacteria bacterium]
MKKLLVFCTAFWMCLSFTAEAHEDHKQHQKAILAISVAFDVTGNLWRATSNGSFVQVDSSSDLGKHFSKAVSINPRAQNIAADGEARPKIAIGPEGHIYLTWTEALAKPFTGYVWFARSINGGKTFEAPIIVHQDRAEITHRFDALNVAPNGNITVAWVDKRDLISAKTVGKHYDGAAIYFATSSDKGASFAVEQKLADSSCECCRIAFTNKPDGTVVAMWRHVFEGSERDHMIAEIPLNASQAVVVKRATFGRWKIDGCPHHGAALASGGEGKGWWGYHMAWFDGGNDDTGKDANLFYARMDGEAWVSSPAKKFGNHKNQAGHPALLSIGEKVWLVWRETDIKEGATKNVVMAMFSEDGGRSWGDASAIASTMDKADYPQLLAKGNQPFLVWNTLKDGLKLVGL